MRRGPLRAFAGPATRIFVAVVLLSGAAVSFAGPAVAAAAWSVAPSASPAGPPSGTFYDVACPSETSCFAVGGLTTATGASPFAEHWDGTKWSIMSVPTARGLFQSISCAGVTSCVAVGGAGDTKLAAKWDGTSWTFVPVADPGTGPANFLSGVACSSATNCFAVGATGSSTLVEQWNGATWSIVTSASVAGALAGVTCESSTDCFAVGSVSGDTSGLTLIEHWDGTSWSIVGSPVVDGADDPALREVSCTSESSCFAVGFAFPADGAESTLIEAWDGASWSIVASPNVSGAAANFLLGVSCSTNTSCFAVGSVNLTPSGPARGLIERWDGTSWSSSGGPSVDSSLSAFRGVTCSSSTNCFAVGDGVIQHWNGSSWSSTAFPAVALTPSNANLAGVSCATATKCFGVGQYTNAAGKVVTLIERPAGATWSVIASPSRAGASESSLASVACPTATACFAVGRAGSGGAYQTLIERWNGSAWSIMASPNVVRAVKGLTPNSLTGVSCSSATNCFAVGYSIYFSYRTVVEHWDGKKWSIVASPNVSTSKTAESVLNAVSCVSATNCVAVGRSASTISNQPGTYRTLTERWNGSAWSIVPSPNAASGSGELASVSCAGAKACVAVGSAYRSAVRNTLIEAWNGTAWTRVASADPASTTHSSLAGVSCAKPTSCVAVGAASGSSNLNKTLVKILAGGHWSIVSAASPAAARTSSLNAVSCPSATTCSAVGNYDTNGAPRTLVERYA
jgi:hypothetical protein